MTKSLIVGCGDVGTRIAKLLSGQNKAIVATESSLLKLSDITQVDACQINLDSAVSFTDDLLACEHIYYLVPPQKSGHKDNRSKHFLAALKAGVDSLNSSIEANTKRIVLISTTGVYGDHDGDNTRKIVALLSARYVYRVFIVIAACRENVLKSLCLSLIHLNAGLLTVFMPTTWRLFV